MPSTRFPSTSLGHHLEGQVALVTGGSRGIGAATCRLLARAGARVVVHFRTREVEAARVARAIGKSRGTALVLGADVADPLQAEALVEEILDRFGRLDVLVNNAGIWERGPLLSMTPEQWRLTMSVNLDGVFHVTRAAARALRARSGRIVNVSSTAGQRGEAFHSHYAATKGALIALTKSWAIELAPLGVRVNCVAPGWVDTDMTARALRGPARRAIERDIPLGRVGRPEDVAHAILFLAGPASSWITGEVLNVNGGSVLCG